VKLLVTQNSLERATGLARVRLLRLMRSNNIAPDFGVEGLGVTPNLHLFSPETAARVVEIAERWRTNGEPNITA
jgi:hypothetical protein